MKMIGVIISLTAMFASIVMANCSNDPTLYIFALGMMFLVFHFVFKPKATNRKDTNK